MIDHQACAIRLHYYFLRDHINQYTLSVKLKCGRGCRYLSPEHSHLRLPHRRLDSKCRSSNINLNTPSRLSTPPASTG